MDATVRKIKSGEVAANRKRGGDLRVMLSPLTVGARSGFMGVGTLAPGERISEHYHPYSEEFVYVVSGTIRLITSGDRPLDVAAGEAVMVPMNTRHRIENHGTEPAFVVFHSSPLAPDPALGHVDTEPAPGPGEDPKVGGVDGTA
ncbi:cupin domain-containing protein [Micromonospora sp. CPCC 205371]|nr:cupin domain-containing protein [Micromonospora sp. CPCC 205371]